MSVRLGRLGLIRLQEQLSERDLQIIHSVASHRFLTTQQIERLHFHDHASSETGARVCRHVLNRLTKEKTLRRLTRRVGGLRAGSAAYIYTLAPVGRRLVGETTARQVREPSLNFLEHSLAIADVHLALREAARAERFELLTVEIEPACWRRYIGIGGSRQILRPDMFVVSAHGEYEYCWFLEIDRGTEYKPTLVRKCRQYETYRRSGKEQQRLGVFPLVVWVTPDEARAREVEKAIRSARNLTQELFRVTTSSDLLDLFAGAFA
jgi:Replication-relaxation